MQGFTYLHNKNVSEISESINLREEVVRKLLDSLETEFAAFQREENMQMIELQQEPYCQLQTGDISLQQATNIEEARGMSIALFGCLKGMCTFVRVSEEKNGAQATQVCHTLFQREIALVEKSDV